MSAVLMAGRQTGTMTGTLQQCIWCPSRACVAQESTCFVCENRCQSSGLNLVTSDGLISTDMCSFVESVSQISHLAHQSTLLSSSPMHRRLFLMMTQERRSVRKLALHELAADQLK